MYPKVLGKLPAGERQKRILASPQYKRGAFQNLQPTPVMGEESNFWKVLRSYSKKPADCQPPRPLPAIHRNLRDPAGPGGQLTWFGHSSYLLWTGGCHILVDPVLSGYAAPLSFMVKAYPGTNIYPPAAMPDIDLLLLTHDHYDHLDFPSLLALRPRVKKILCSLGVGAHLEYWGFDPALIIEMDWWDQCEPYPGLVFHAAPARHFSGRGLKRGRSLWTSYILQSADGRFFLGGDSGYGSHFREIGQRFGPFDLSLLECGQYNDHWPHIHMAPEQTVAAALDLGTRVLMPVHWGKFTLSLHPWNEPVKRVSQEARRRQLPLCLPMIGEKVDLQGPYPQTEWWNF